MKTPEQLIQLQSDIEKAQKAFATALKEAGYIYRSSGSYEDTRHYYFHPSLKGDLERNTKMVGIESLGLMSPSINTSWIYSLPPGMAFEFNYED